MKKKYYIFVLMIFLLINIIIFIFLKSNKYNVGKQSGDNSHISYSENNIVTTIEIGEKILPENRREFENLYEGDLNVDTLYYKLYTLVNNIEKLYDLTNDMKSEDLNKFYNNNANYIEIATSITTCDEFIRMIEKADLIYKNDSQNSYYAIVLLLDSFETKNNITKIEAELKYRDNKKIKFVIVMNDVKRDINFKF